MLGKDTLKKHTQHWQRFLCYALRMTDPADDTLPASQIQESL